jgi:hypothetical protein
MNTQVIGTITKTTIFAFAGKKYFLLLKLENLSALSTIVVAIFWKHIVGLPIHFIEEAKLSARAGALGLRVCLPGTWDVY